MERNGIGHRLRVARGVLSQAEVGKLLGIGKNTLSNYELEKTSPNADFIARFCKALNVSPSWLQTGDSPMESPGKVAANEAPAEYSVDELHALRLENATLKGNLVARQVATLQAVSAVAARLGLGAEAKNELTNAVLFPEAAASCPSPPLPAKNAANGE